MHYFSAFLTFFSLVFGLTFAEEEAVCHKCEVIREYNKTHHKNYEYYDDYLKEQPKEDKQNTPEEKIGQ